MHDIPDSPSNAKAFPMVNISIVIPTMNESENVDELLQRIIPNAEKVVGQDFEIIFVDDDSKDSTRYQISQWQHDHRIKIIHRREEKGLASAVLAGARAAKGEILLIMDADLSHPPEAIPDIIRPILDGKKDMVIGSRYVSGGGAPGWSVFRQLVSKTATLPARVFTDIRDPLSGFFAVRKKTLLPLGQDVQGFKIGLAILARGGDLLRSQEVPIIFHDREKGHSKASLSVFLTYCYQIMAMAGGNISKQSGLRFGLVGFLGFIIDFSVFHALFHFGLGLGPANLFSFATAVLFNFLLNRQWAFADRSIGWQNILRKYFLFISIALMALFLRGGILALIINTWHLPVSIALTVAIGTAAVVNYLGSAFFVFPLNSDWLTPGIRWRVLSLAIIGYTILLRLVYMGLPELLHQEAYYWNYGQHMALGYLDHPPLLAWMIRGSTELFGTREFAVRLVAFFCWMITAFFSYRTTRFFYDRTTALGVLLLIAVLPGFFCTGFLSTPDAPLIACWAATLFFLQKALIQEQQSAWFGVGIALGLGMLSKYTIVLLAPCILVYMTIDRRSRKWYAKPEPYLAACLSLLIFLPVIIWNAENNWASFVFQGPRRFTGMFEFSLDALLGSILLLLTPTGFLAMMWVLLPGKEGFKQKGHETIEDVPYAFGFVFTFVPLSIFIFFSIFREFKINWTIPIWLAFLPFIAKIMITTPRNRSGRLLSIIHRLWPSTLVCTTLTFGAVLYYAVLGFPGLGYFGDQPFLLGWEQMEDEIESIRKNIEGDREAVVVVGMDKYKIASGLSFYRKKLAWEHRGAGSEEALIDTAGRNCFGTNSLMYAFWYPCEQYAGRTMILVGDEPEGLTRSSVTRSFKQLEPIREIKLSKNGKSVKTYYLRVGYGYRPIAG